MAAQVSESPRGVLRVVLAVALGVVLATLGIVLGVLESFLHPMRLFGLPVGWVGAAVVNFGVTQGVGRGARSRLYALVPGVGWLLSVIVLSVGRPEGDFVVPGTWVGYAYLIAGSLGAAAGVMLLPWYSLRDLGSAHRDTAPPAAG